LACIGLVFAMALVRIGGELRWVRELTELLGADLVIRREGDEATKATKPRSFSLAKAEIRDQVEAMVAPGADPVWAQKQIRTWQMRVQRLEPALAFWVDLLRQLGLLGTVLGLGISMATGAAEPTRLLAPLGVAVWTTVAGLSLSIWLSAVYSGQLAAWVDACEKNIEAWEARRREASR
jgi:hypothetical protein